jgi:hypothetical protein
VGNVNTGVGYNDIPAAITAASAGDILKVCAGTFTVPTSSTFNVNKSLTLRGANYQVDPTVTPSVRGAESTIVVNHSSGVAMTISASNVIVDGFDFEVKGARDAINVKTTLVAAVLPVRLRRMVLFLEKTPLITILPALWIQLACQMWSSTEICLISLHLILLLVVW